MNTVQMNADYQEFLAWKATRRIDVTKSWKCTMMLPPRANASLNSPAFLSIQEIYSEFPERFTVIGDIHSAPEPGSPSYFSMRYNRPRGGSWSFHAYGAVVGTKFMIHTITQAHGPAVMEIFQLAPI